jgi:hypothetical protein
MISTAQKKARENFKKAIEYRKKTGCTLKQAFEHVSGKKTVAKKVGTVNKDLTAYDVLKYREKIGEKKFRALTPAQRVKGAEKNKVLLSLLKKKKKVSGYVTTIRKGSKTNVLYTKQGNKTATQQKLFGVKKKATKKPTEKSILNKIHKVKHEVERLDELQHKHMSGIFDIKIISDLDSLKKQYFKLAKKYHPDAGGTTIQFQELQKEYEGLLKKLLKGSTLNTEQQENEIVIDQAIRDIINSLINIEGLNVEVIGKWLWISGDTYPVRTTLKQAGLTFIKKAGIPYWVYKGVESTSRGKMSIEDIKNKYGTHKFDVPKTKKISGFRVTATQRNKLKRALLKITKGLDKRPI